MKKLFKIAFRLQGARLKRSFDAATKHPREVQKRLLLNIVGANANTVYGRRYGFSRIRGIDDFVNRHPIQTFVDLEDYVERIKGGETRILSAEPPCMFNLTSGTTDRPKFVPATKLDEHLRSELSMQWLYRSLQDHPSFLDDAVLCIAGDPIEGKTASGVPFGSASGALQRLLPLFVRRSLILPLGLSGLSSYELRYYVMARLAAADNLSFIVTPNPTTLLRISQTLVESQERIVRSVRDGMIGCASEAITSQDTAFFSSIAGRIKKNPERAKSLERIILKHDRLLPQFCWEELKLIGCWLGGTVGFQADQLTPYFGENVNFRDVGYLASEASMTIPHQDASPAGILAITNNFYEFVPEGETESSCSLQCHELEAGREYKIILTNWSGLYRYDIHDVIKVQGFYNATPLIAFVRKGNDLLNIAGEKLHVNHFLKAFDRLRNELGIPVAQFRAVSNHQELCYELLVCFVVEPSPECVSNQILPFIDNALSEANVEYKSKRNSKRLGAPRIHLMGHVWVEDAKQECLKSGRRDIQYKWRTMTNEISLTDRKHIRHSFQID